VLRSRRRRERAAAAGRGGPEGVARCKVLLFFLYSFPQGVLLITDTCLVPPDEFSLAVGDSVHVTVGELSLENPVAA
jgi:hypothetical protein